MGLHNAPNATVLSLCCRRLTGVGAPLTHSQPRAIQAMVVDCICLRRLQHLHANPCGSTHCASWRIFHVSTQSVDDACTLARLRKMLHMAHWHLQADLGGLLGRHAALQQRVLHVAPPDNVRPHSQLLWRDGYPPQHRQRGAWLPAACSAAGGGCRVPLTAAAGRRRHLQQRIQLGCLCCVRGRFRCGKAPAADAALAQQ